jgi:4-amino-4-deoxy-L-arabinose transferase-like glycosyltransferase
MARPGSYTVRNRAFSIAALVVLGAGFCWRLLYLVRISLFIDEFTTILAAQMIVKSGLPRLPSGLFYDLGLLFNYILSAFIGLAGFNEAVARFPSVCFSLLTVAVTYRLGKRAFSPGAALMAATLLAMMPESVVWGARARPYAPLQFWVMVGTWAMVEGITTRWRGAGALFTGWRWQRRRYLTWSAWSLC